MEKYNSLISNAMYATNIDVQNTLSESSQTATFKYLEFDLTSQAFLEILLHQKKKLKITTKNINLIIHKKLLNK